ncbi:hypothetical protein [Methylocucumis oryzae]|uniref:hypothetical protein n=1 Tax=Methylocucumis oryzae TaxID=1632867 RepID=UPI0019553DE6|nr:hypothetical protein [Methylocucumis oryzae]
MPEVFAHVTPNPFLDTEVCLPPAYVLLPLQDAAPYVPAMKIKAIIIISALQ